MTSVNKKEIDKLLKTAMRRSERYRVYTKELGKTKAEAYASFDVKKKMKMNGLISG